MFRYQCAFPWLISRMWMPCFRLCAQVSAIPLSTVSLIIVYLYLVRKRSFTQIIIVRGEFCLLIKKLCKLFTSNWKVADKHKNWINNNTMVKNSWTLIFPKQFNQCYLQSLGRPCRREFPSFCKNCKWHVTTDVMDST